MYGGWSDFLPRDVEVCAVQLPGRENRLDEPLIRNLDTLVPMLVDVIRENLNLPYLVFGHSMGALIAFELAQALRRSRLRLPEHLFVSGARAPHLPAARPLLHDLPEPALLEALVDLQGTAREVLEEPELRELFLPLIRADMQLAETYVPSTIEPLPCPISAFGGVDDTRVSREAIDQWHEYTTGTFESVMLPGGHFFLRSRREQILQYITRACALIS
jgi:medium-chain acyl-[acyl-carrier-protein] hydrolase